MSYSETFKSFLILSLAIYGAIRILLPSEQKDFSFQIRETSVVYHSNWTQSYDKLKHISELQNALTIKKIESVDISFCMSALNFEDLTKIFTTQFRPYHTLKLNLGSLNLGTKGVQYILSLIPNGIEDLELYFDSVQADNKLGLILANKLNQLTSLKSVKVSLILSGVGDQGFTQFFNTHNIQKQLTSLKLVLIGNQLNSTVFAKFDSYLESSNLQQFGLNLYANNIQAEGAQYIAKALKNKSFKRFELDLYFNNVTQIGTKDLAESISTIQKLESLSLNFDFNYIKNEGGKELGTMFKNLPQLNSIQIGVASKNFGYLGFKSLIDGLSTQKSLKSLRLRCGINRVGINGAGIVNKMLEGMQNLETLAIGFVQNYIGDQGLSEISQTVSTKLPNLRNVQLDLGFNDAKGYGGIGALKHLATRNWDEIRLRLSNNEFRDADVKLMKPHIKTILRKSETFIFEFMDTAISRLLLTDLQNLFSSQGTGQDKIYVNSIIPQEEQQQAQIAAGVRPPKASTTSKDEQPKVSNDRKAEQKPSKPTSSNTNSTDEQKVKDQTKKQKQIEDEQKREETRKKNDELKKRQQEKKQQELKKQQEKKQQELKKQEQERRAKKEQEEKARKEQQLRKQRQEKEREEKLKKQQEQRKKQQDQKREELERRKQQQKKQAEEEQKAKKQDKKAQAEPEQKTKPKAETKKSTKSEEL